MNKIDTEESAENIKEFHKKFKVPKKILFEVSAERGDGMEKLESAIKKIV